MSAVRMCDKQSSAGCHRIFSERADGWGTGELSVMKRNEHGAMRPVTDRIDICPACNADVANVGPLPLAIQAYQPPTHVVPDDAETVTEP